MTQLKTRAQRSHDNGRWIVLVAPTVTTVTPVCTEARGCLLSNDKLIHTDSSADSCFLHVQIAAAAASLHPG